LDINIPVQGVHKLIDDYQKEMEPVAEPCQLELATRKAQIFYGLDFLLGQ
jgi:hypothetical protein